VGDVNTVHNKTLGTIRHHMESARDALIGTPLWVWPVPALLCVIILLILQTPLGWITAKPFQEIAAPMVIGLTAGLALAVHYWLRSLFTLMLACFAVALFFRELHFVGTNNGIYLAVIILAVWASAKREEIREFIGNRWIAGLLACAVWTYFVTKLFDRHYLSFLPNYVAWENNAEESLETFGHLMVFALVVLTLRLGSLRQGREPRGPS